ncbi:MAG: type II toxin-antitoxin system PemK/MazF family toxin [Planctomycetaceae bacterium]|nr:type II toxin-antitoxin system PemK/MazF family toxin [Planctomycetaceae bacterium]
MNQRGNVVIIEFPFVDGQRGKNRPALVIQADANNQRLQNTIVSMISGNIRLAGKVNTQILIDPQSIAGRTSGLHGPSVVKCENIYTVRQQDILQVIGRLSVDLMNEVDMCLKASLGLT